MTQKDQELAEAFGMNQRLEDEVELKRYLLGELAEEERIVVEERLFLDSDYLLQLQAVEDELVDDYVYGDLATNDRGKFETHFLSRSGRLDDLRFARALKSHIAAEESVGIVPSTPVSGETVRPQAAEKVSFFPSLFRNKPATGLMLAMAAGVILAVFVWLAVVLVRQRQPGQIQAQRSEPVKSEPAKPSSDNEASNLNGNRDGGGQGVRPVEIQENARNRAGGEGTQRRDQTPQQARRGAGSSPTPRQSSGSIFTFLLLPGGNVRGEGEANKVILTSVTGSLVLQLPLIEGENYRSYQATLQQGDRTVRTWASLKPSLAETGKIISVSVPVSILQEQSYRITLGGLDASGHSRKIMDYSFRVEKR